MDDKTLKALRGSIKKWEGIVDGDEDDMGAENCDLCKLFNNLSIRAPYCCDGCPVKEKTNMQFCIGTPHKDWVAYQNRSPSSYGVSWTVFDKKSFYLALAELEFLKSLLPAGEDNDT